MIYRIIRLIDQEAVSDALVVIAALLCAIFCS